jgi:hypothetical protein
MSTQIIITLPDEIYQQTTHPRLKFLNIVGNISTDLINLK